MADVTKEMILRANGDLKQLKGTPNMSEADWMRIARLTHDFQKLMQKFQDIQRKGLDMSRDFIAKAQAIEEGRGAPRNPASDTSDEKNRAAEKAELLTQSQKNWQAKEDMAIQNEIAYNQALIQDREQSIQEIESTMGEVHEIFRDLAITVEEQRDFVDNIEINIEQAGGETRRGWRQLVVARDRQRRRRSNFIFTLIMAVIIFVLVMAIIHAIF